MESATRLGILCRAKGLVERRVLSSEGVLSNGAEICDGTGKGFLSCSVVRWRKYLLRLFGMSTLEEGVNEWL